MNEALRAHYEARARYRRPVSYRIAYCFHYPIAVPVDPQSPRTMGPTPEWLG